MAQRTHQLGVNLDNADDRITVDEWLDIEEGKSRTVVAVLSRFVQWDGKQLTEEEARAKLGSISIRQFKLLLEEFREIVMGMAVPNASGQESDSA